MEEQEKKELIARRMADHLPIIPDLRDCGIDDSDLKVLDPSLWDLYWKLEEARMVLSEYLFNEYEVNS